MIKELLEARIRPAVAEDGGDIVFRGWDEKTGVVTAKMQGACDVVPKLERHAQERHLEVLAQALRPGGERRGAGGGGRHGSPGHGDHEQVRRSGGGNR